MRAVVLFQTITLLIGLMTQLETCHAAERGLPLAARSTEQQVA